MPPNRFQTLSEKASYTVAVFHHESFTMEDFVNALKRLYDITDLRDISLMLKFLIESDSIHPIRTLSGLIDAWGDRLLPI